MSKLLGIVARLHAVLGRRASERRMDDEFRFHLEMEAEKNIANGMSVAAAHRAARVAFGGTDAHREQMRDERGARWIADAVADIRYAIRILRRSPGFALAATITLALGIGVNGLVFGAVNGLLFRALPVSHPDRLVALFSLPTESGQPGTIAYEDYLDFRDRRDVFADLAAQTGVPLNLRTADGGDMVWGEMVTENFFSVLEMRPSVGRFFAPENAAPGTDPYVVLSYESWQRRFAGDPAIAGRAVRINGTQFTILGVAPKGFHGTRKFSFWPEMWVPVGMHDVIMPGSTNLLRGRGGGWANVVGRLRPGRALSEAQAGASTVARQLALAYPETNRQLGVLVIPAGNSFENPAFAPPRILRLASSLGVFGVTLVLLIVCANLANLLLARAATRQHELAVRLALGCSRARLVRQLLVEAIVLATPGALLGLAAIFAGPMLQARMVPHLQFRVGFDVSPDAHVIVYTAAIAVVAVLLFGLSPALRASRPSVVSSLKSALGDSTNATRGSRVGMRATLVVAQLALSVILLTGGTLFVRSVLAARAVNLSFDPRDRVTVSANPGLQGYDHARGVAFYRDVLARVRALPSVVAVSWGFPVPFDTYGRSIPLYIDGIAGTPEHRVVNIESSVVDVGFLKTMGIPLTSGRDFAIGDTTGAPEVMVISRAMATRFWPGGNAIGQRARVGSADGPEIVVVGIAADAKFNSLGESPEPRAYVALAQTYRSWETLVVHLRGTSDRAMDQIRAAVAAVDPALPTFGAMRMEQNVENALNNAQTAATFAGFFGLQALLIASIGLYALVANVVASRTREIGVRMALGATHASVMRLIIGRAGRLGAIGIVVGVIGAALVARLMRGLLFGLSPHDPATFVIVPTVLAVIVLAASYLPARRATHLDPAVALRD